MIKFYNVKDSVKDDNKLQESQIKEIEVNDEEDLKPLTAVEINNTQTNGKIEKDDKQSFEDFKNMYKGVIDLKCNQEYGSNEDKDLWEDMAKQLYLNSKEYILQGDEHKPKQLEKKEESNKLQEEEITPANIKEKALEILPKEDVEVKYSDLYIKVSDKSKELINKLQFKNNGLLTTFRSPIDNEMWYDIPFANLEDYITSKTESNNNTYDYKSGDVVDILDSYGKWLNSSDRIKYVIDRPATKEEIGGIWDIDTPCYIVKTLGMTDDTKFLNGTSKEPITRLRHTIYKSKEHKINENDGRNCVLILELNKDVNNRELVYVTDTDNKADVNELRGNKIDGYKILGAYFEEEYDGDAKQYVNEFKNDNDFKFVYKPLSYIKSNLQKSDKMNEASIDDNASILEGLVNFLNDNNITADNIDKNKDLVEKYLSDNKLGISAYIPTIYKVAKDDYGIIGRIIFYRSKNEWGFNTSSIVIESNKINESFDLDLIEKNIKGKRLSDAARYLGALVNGDRNSFEIQGSELVSKLNGKDKVMCDVEGNDIIKSIVKDFTHLTDKTESLDKTCKNESYYIKLFNKDNTDIDTIEANTEQEAIKTAEEKMKEGFRAVVYNANNKEALYDYDPFEGLQENKLQLESRDRVAENLSKFIYDLTTEQDTEAYGETAWSGNQPTKMGNGVTVYEVYKNGKSNYTMNDIKKAVLEKFPELDVYGTAYNSILFYKPQKTESKLQEDTVKVTLNTNLNESNIDKYNTIPEIKDRLREINKQLAYIRRRDSVSLSIGTEQEQEELRSEKAKLNGRLRKLRNNAVDMDKMTPEQQKEFKQRLKDLQLLDDDESNLQSAIQSYRNHYIQEFESYTKKEENNTDLEYRYMLLDRLKQDCEYFLGNGNGNAEHSLWAKDIDEQIDKMKELYNSFTDDQKPEWITMEDIDNYQKKMKELKNIKEKKIEGVPDLQTIQDIEEYINNIKDEHTKSILHHILEDEKSKENPSIGYLTMAIRKVLDIEQERNKEKKTESMPDDWYNAMYDKYVPNTGEANTIGGEILRTFSGISRMFYQNGDKIWRGNMKNNSYVLDPLADKLDDLLPQEGKDLMSIMANSTTDNAYEKRLNALEDYVYNYLKDNDNLFGDNKIQESNTNNQIRDKEALDEVIDLAIERIESDKSLIDDFWGPDAENNTRYNDFIIDVCNNLNIDWNTFNVFEDAYVEDKIQSYFQKDIDAKGKKEESAISDYTLSEINKVLSSNGNEFTLKIVNSNEDAETKTLNIDREDLISIYNVLGGNKDSLQEDQYENERRKGKPSIKKIAEDEYYDNQDWYIQHIKDYKNEDDFIKKEIAEIAEEYNLKENTARSVCKEIYKLAKDVLTESRPDKQAARDKMFRDSKMKLKLPNKFKDINEIVSYLENCEDKTDVMNVNVAVGGFNRQLHNDMLDFADKFIKENGYLDTYIDKDGNEQEGKFEEFKQAMIDFVKNYKIEEESIIEEAVTDPENPDNKDTIGITVVYEKAVTFYYVRNPKKIKGDKVFKVTDTVYVPRDKARDYLDGKISYKEMESIIYNIIDRSCRKWNKEYKDYLHKDYEPFRIITFDVFERDFE